MRTYNIPIQSPARHNRGFSLMEVLVAMLVLAIGLLGLASLQAQSLKFNHDAYVRSQATLLAAEIMDKMRADPTADYSVADPNAVDCSPLNPTAYDDSSPDMAVCFWVTGIQAMLPSGQGQIVFVDLVPDPDMFDVTIQWSDRTTDNQPDCDAFPAPGRTWDAVNNVCLISQIWAVLP